MKIKMNVFEYDYLPWKYIPNWGRNIKQFFKNIKYAYQRATKGYCDRDVWQLGDHTVELLSDMITNLADISHGFPGKEPWHSPEKWDTYLREMAEHFRLSNISMSEELYGNCWWDLMEEQIEKSDFINETYKDEEKYNELREKWLNRNKEIDKLQEEELHKAVEMFSECYKYLWD